MSTLTIKNRLMAIVACVLCALGASAYDFYVDSVYYNIKSPNTVEVTSKANRVASYSGDVVIPPTVTYDGVTYTVIGIGYEAFRPSPISSVQLPMTLQYLDKGAFNRCGQITEIHIPESVTAIGTWAFYDCKKLVSVNIPEGVTSIGELTFGNCNILPSITLPESLQTIGSEAFDQCNELTSIFIPKNVSQIHPQAFSYCRKLMYIEVDSENPYFDSRDNCNAIIETATNKLVAGSSITVIPSTVTELGDYSFSYRQSFTSIDIPNSVKRIGNYAFASTAVQDVRFPDSLVIVGASAFEFSNIKSALLPNTVTTIGTGAFKHCSKLATVTLSENLTDIKSSVFESCGKLTDVTIPGNVTRIGYDAFWSCSGIKSIIIPRSVTQIDKCAFRGCSGIATLVVEEGNPVYDSRANCNAVIETATNKLILGCQSTVIPNSVDTIGYYSFYGMNKLRSIDIPNTVNHIEAGAFHYCYYLHHIHTGDSVTVIGEYAFADCNGLYIDSIGLIDLKLGKLLKTIERCAFERCSDLTTVVFPDSVIYIGDRAFGSANLLTSVTCKALTPPVMGVDVFHADALTNATLYVPLRTIEEYRTADVWKDFANIEGIYLPVDANGDSEFNITDVNVMVNRLINGETIEDPAYDLNCDGEVNVTDVILLINLLVNS